MKAYKVIIISDVHLGTENSKANELIEFLNNYKTDLLIINGDFVDGWALSRGVKWKPKHTKVISKVLDISRRSSVIWVRGNHDEFLHNFMDMSLGKLEIVEEYILSLSEDKKYLIFHGDILDIFSTRWKWLSKMGAYGYELALSINNWYNKWRKYRNLEYHSISKDIKAGVKAATNFITDFEKMAAKQAHVHNCIGVMCGHIHSPANRYIDGIHYLNSGDWVENLTAILIDFDNNIEIKEFHKNEVKI